MTLPVTRIDLRCTEWIERKFEINFDAIPLLIYRTYRTLMQIIHGLALNLLHLLLHHFDLIGQHIVLVQFFRLLQQHRRFPLPAFLHVDAR